MTHMSPRCGRPCPVAALKTKQSGRTATGAPAEVRRDAGQCDPQFLLFSHSEPRKLHSMNEKRAVAPYDTNRPPRLGSRVSRIVGISLAVAALATPARAFSLLGPFTDWMDVQKYYRLPVDIGSNRDCIFASP